MAKPTLPPLKFERAKKWIAGLTGVIVVLPALVNGGVDVYTSIRNLPTTESERHNVELFQKYFNKEPVFSFPIPVKRNDATLEANFSVYEEGDVFVEYGRFTQWFPFPNAAMKTTSISPITIAHAADDAAVTQGLRGSGAFRESNSRLGGDLVLRERVYQNGVTERQTINARTGVIIQSSNIPTPPGTTQVKKPSPGHAMKSRFETIDLDKINKTNKALPAP